MTPKLKGREKACEEGVIATQETDNEVDTYRNNIIQESEKRASFCLPDGMLLDS